MKKQVLLLFLSIYIIGCTNPSENTTNSFTILSKQTNIIKGKEGTILIIPSNCFVDEIGNAINEPVTLELIEAYSITDMIQNNLTTIADSGILVSGGMINLDFSTKSGKAVQIAKDKHIRIEAPLNASDTNQYAIFTQENNVWASPTPSNSQLIHVPLDQLDLTILQAVQGHVPNAKDIHFLDYLNHYDEYQELIKVIDKTYFASREFQERFNILLDTQLNLFDGEGSIHGSYASLISNNYADNITQPLWYADSIVVDFLIDQLNYLHFSNKQEKNKFDQLIATFTGFYKERKTFLDPTISLTKEDVKKLETYQKLANHLNTISFNIQSSGWYNCDFFLSSKYPVELIHLDVETNIKVTDVILMLKNEKVLLNAQKEGKTSYSFNAQLPKEDAIIVAFGLNDKQFHFSKKSIRLGDSTTEKLDLVPIEENELKSKLEEFNNKQ